MFKLREGETINKRLFRLGVPEDKWDEIKWSYYQKKQYFPSEKELKGLKKRLAEKKVVLEKKTIIEKKEEIVQTTETKKEIKKPETKKE